MPKEHKPRARVKNWCFTWFDYDEKVLEAMVPERANYLVYQLETCPDTGRAHVQGYLQMPRSVDFGVV